MLFIYLIFKFKKKITQHFIASTYSHPEADKHKMKLEFKARIKTR